MQKQKQNRITKILLFRDSHTLEQTGKKFGITGERVRQIEFEKDRKRCARHDRYFYNKCSFCMADSYPKMLKKMSAKEIEIEVNREANNRHRGYLATQRRIAIINLLLKTKTITEVAQIMKRDRSTINHYVEKYAN